MFTDDAMLLKNVNGSSSCFFPEEMLDAAVIENPCNKNEIIVFGSYRSCTIYIYTKSNNTIRKCDESLKESPNDKRLHLQTFIVRGNDKNTLIVLWYWHNHFIDPPS